MGKFQPGDLVQIDGRVGIDVIMLLLREKLIETQGCIKQLWEVIYQDVSDDKSAKPIVISARYIRLIFRRS